jgi:glycosyltransferase involved in cell wall biosynthesis
MVRDFGRGRPNVHFILDCAHSLEMVLDADRQNRKLDRMATRRGIRACYFGRLVPYKGVDRMVQAVREVNRSGVEIVFDVFGAGESLEELRDLVASCGLDSVVHFHGSRPYGQEFFDALESYDVLLAAPLSEDTPRSAIDAQALGMVVVAFDTYYYRELSEMGAGVVVMPWLDCGAMARALMELATNRSRLVELAGCSLAFAATNTQNEWLARRARWTVGN